MFQPGNDGVHKSYGESTGTSSGTTLTANAAANTKGVYTDIGANTTFNCEALTLFLLRNSAAANYMLDIAVGEAAAEAIIIPDLYFAAAKVTNEHGVQVTLPIHVPKGTQLRARVAASTGGITCALVIICHETGLGGAPGFSRAVALYAPATSRGVAINPGAVANKKGSWTQLAASSTAEIAGMFGFIGYNADTTRAANGRMLLDIGMGASGFETVIQPNYSLGWSTIRDGPSNCVWIPPFACAVPASSRIVARAQCDIVTAGDRTIDLGLYGLVP